MGLKFVAVAFQALFGHSCADVLAFLSCFFPVAIAATFQLFGLWDASTALAGRVWGLVSELRLPLLTDTGSGQLDSTSVPVGACLQQSVCYWKAAEALSAAYVLCLLSLLSDAFQWLVSPGGIEVMCMAQEAEKVAGVSA